MGSLSPGPISAAHLQIQSKIPNRKSKIPVANSTKLVRQWRLLKMLAARRHGVTVEELAAEFSMVPRSILRDLNELREVGFSLVDRKDGNRKRWSLSEAEGLVNLRFTHEEAAALYLGRQFLEPLVGTYFHAGARSAFGKIRATLGEPALRHLERLAAGFYHSARGWSDYSAKGQIIDNLVLAIEDQLITRIEYRSLKSTEPVSLYNLHPLSLVYHRGALYLVAHSDFHNSVRTFKVDRISAADMLGLKFAEKRDFDPTAFFEHSFGIFHSENAPALIRVAFHPDVRRILEERQFHPSQRLSRRKDGRTLAEFHLSSVEEFKSWILSFGPLAEVLEPPELREQIVQCLRAAADLYNPETSDTHR